jgi:hypothetical protein
MLEGAEPLPQSPVDREWGWGAPPAGGTPPVLVVEILSHQVRRVPLQGPGYGTFGVSRVYAPPDQEARPVGRQLFLQFGFVGGTLRRSFSQVVSDYDPILVLFRHQLSPDLHQQQR